MTATIYNKRRVLSVRNNAKLVRAVKSAPHVRFLIRKTVVKIVFDAIRAKASTLMIIVVSPNVEIKLKLMTRNATMETILMQMDVAVDVNWNKISNA